MRGQLANKTYKNFTRLSRYANFPIYYNIVDKKWVQGTSAWFKDTTLYQLHQVTYNDTLDTLSLKYYGNPTYYWVIADFNRITDPFAELVVGSKIKIPTISYVSYEEY